MRLLCGQIPSLRDERGAFFIDRDPDLFKVILNYLRSNEIDISMVNIKALKHEAEFYGLESLVKRLNLCDDNFSGCCGDLLFNSSIHMPDFSNSETLTVESSQTNNDGILGLFGISPGNNQISISQAQSTSNNTSRSANQLENQPVFNPESNSHASSSNNPLKRFKKSFLLSSPQGCENRVIRRKSFGSRLSVPRNEDFSGASVSKAFKKGLQKISKHASINSPSSQCSRLEISFESSISATSQDDLKEIDQQLNRNKSSELNQPSCSKSNDSSIIPLSQLDPDFAQPGIDERCESTTEKISIKETDTQEKESKPVTHLVNNQNWLVVAYGDRLSVYLFVDLLGWFLVWLSPILSCDIDRVNLASVNMTQSQRATQNLVLASNAPNLNVNNSQILLNNIPNQNILPLNIITSTNSNHYSVPSNQNILQPQASQASTVNNQNQNLYANQGTQLVQPGIIQPFQNMSVSPSQGQQSVQLNFEAMITISCGPVIILWTLTPKSNSGNGRQFVTSSNASIMIDKNEHPKLPSPDARPFWNHEMVGRFNLNQRPVDHLFFVGLHLVALSRKGLVGVRHVMSGFWQVWSTVPILSYGVVDEELLLLGCADGRISSINIQKFPLRIGDNDLLVTLMYKDPLGDPVTALSIYVAPCATNYPNRYWLEIAYGTLSGRVCIVVQRPETMSYSPQLFQTFQAHRSMITKVVLSERHLVSVCNELNHVRTWVVSRFRGMISTQPSSSPIASFHVTALDQDEPQALLKEIIRIVEKVDSTQKKTNSPTPAAVTIASNQQPNINEKDNEILMIGNVRVRNQNSLSRLLVGCSRTFNDQSGNYSVAETNFGPGTHIHQISETNNQREKDKSNTQLSIPRTSWLHEDHGTTISQQSTARASYQSNGGTLHQNPGFSSTQIFQRIMNSQLNRFSLYGTNNLKESITIQKNSKSQESLMNCKPLSNSFKLKRPLIGLHRHSNQIGPFGERDEQLLFIQKLTPGNSDLFIRLASNGKRVCVIHSLDDQPITAFCMQSLDASNKVATRPQRFILTGHQNGTIQIWDLSTALGSIKPYLMPEDYLSIPALYANNSLNSVAGGVGHYTNPGVLSVQHPQGMTGMYSSITSTGSHAQSISGMLPHINRDSGHGLSGPTPVEILEQLRNCCLMK